MVEGREKLEYFFQFKFPDGNIFGYKVQIDRESKTLVNPVVTPKSFQFFTNLNSNQCENCPLKSSEFPECPVAKNLVQPLNMFKNVISYQSIELVVKSNAMSYSKEIQSQEALETLLELVMIASECPHMDFLKPTILEYVPFQEEHEFVLKCLKSYFLQHYMTKGEDEEPSLEVLSQNFKDLKTVNRGILKRIKELETEDSGRNAIVFFDSIIQCFEIELEQKFPSAKESFAPKK